MYFLTHLLIQKSVAMTIDNRTRASTEARKSNNIHTLGIIATQEQEHNERRLAPLEAFTVTHNVNSMWKWYHVLFIAEVGLNAPVIQPLAKEAFQTEGEITLVIAVGIYTILLYSATKIICKNWYARLDSHVDLSIALAEIDSSPKTSITLEQEQRNSIRRTRVIAYATLIGTTLFILMLILLRSYMNSGHQVWFDFTNPFGYGLVLGSFLLFFFMIRQGKHNHEYRLYKATKRTVNRGKKNLEKLRMQCKDYEQSCAIYTQKADEQNEPTYPDRDTEICLNRLRSVDISSDQYFSRIQDQELCIRVVVAGVPRENTQVSAVTTEGVQLYKYTDERGICKITWRSTHNYLKNLTVSGIHVPGSKFHSKEPFTIDLAVLKQRFDLLAPELSQFFPGSAKNGIHNYQKKEL